MWFIHLLTCKYSIINDNEQHTTIIRYDKQQIFGEITDDLKMNFSLCVCFCSIFNCMAPVCRLVLLTKSTQLK